MAAIPSESLILIALIIGLCVLGMLNAIAGQIRDTRAEITLRRRVADLKRRAEEHLNASITIVDDDEPGDVIILEDEPATRAAA
ncbi:MAG: hypothetical protein DYG93_03580 [Leptolyngbya sp. PLA2]|nr:hypothetical protein [Leptolyngbya sp.]MCE7970734.1 hypothetical protein [Leptolyngbya sp. PL-A2]MCQ3939889.1 hypothetical protein [cyanobacterium CYA1]MCZ7633517.1 hypothetical protein [Phycisphaerales bacterium]MDL1903365.1 hypothetical protein [Synechococcales cyanobacterium CNB]GIK18064.1 MAG: hypothetical protein BroJett004_02280 [Planctomycetota bacterium]